MNTKRHAHTCLVSTWIMILIAMSSHALAQDTAENDAVIHKNLITANPFGYVLQWYNAEYERAIRPNTTLGFTASYAAPFDDGLIAGNAVFRFYPQGTALKGFYVGGRTGVYHLNDQDDHGTYLGAGLELGYTWLMGARENWYLGMGAGITRLFGDVHGAVIPQVRFVNFGYAF